MLDGRRLNHQPSPLTVRPSRWSSVTPGRAAKARQTSSVVASGVADLAVDLAGGHVPAVTAQQLRQRRILGAERREHVQGGQHARVSEPEIAEVEVPGMLTAEDRTGFRHPRLDERVAHPGAHGLAAVLGDDLGDRQGGDQVMNDRRAGLPLQSRAAISAVSTDGGTMSARSSTTEHRSASPSKARPRSAPDSVTARCRSWFGGLDRIRLMVGEGAVQLEVQRHRLMGSPAKTGGTVCPAIPFRVHRYGERADPGHLDQ